MRAKGAAEHAGLARRGRTGAREPADLTLLHVARGGEAWILRRDRDGEREAALASAHVLMALHTPDRLAERAPLLRWIQGAGAGVEQFGKAGLAKDRVVLTNCSGLSSGSMAEWVIGRLLQVWKRLREADEFQRFARRVHALQ